MFKFLLIIIVTALNYSSGFCQCQDVPPIPNTASINIFKVVEALLRWCYYDHDEEEVRYDIKKEEGVLVFTFIGESAYAYVTESQPGGFPSVKEVPVKRTGKKIIIVLDPGQFGPEFYLHIFFAQTGKNIIFRIEGEAIFDVSC